MSRIKITRYGEEWLNPMQVIERNNLTGYTVKWLGDNPHNLRENLWEITGENIIADFAVLNPENFDGEWSEYVANYVINQKKAEILAQTNFNQRDIRLACRAIILQEHKDAVEASPEIPATETTPLIPAVEAQAEIPEVTLEDAWLNPMINSSDRNKNDWQDEPNINLNDPRVIGSLALMQLPNPVTIDRIKLEILKLKSA